MTVLPPPTKYSIDLRTVYIAVVQPLIGISTYLVAETSSLKSIVAGVLRLCLFVWERKCMSRTERSEVVGKEIVVIDDR